MRDFIKKLIGKPRSNELVNKINDLSNEQLWAIDRQWLRADHVHIAFHKEEISKRFDKKGKRKKIQSKVDYFIKAEGSFLCIWYALLFSVLEGLKERRIDLTILKNYDDKLYKDLKNFRNSVFHSPSKYWDKRFLKIISNYDTSNKSKIEKLHKELALYLQVEIRKRNISGDSSIGEMLIKND
ncbi:MAG TPA: hypothetical protein VGF75_04880 [Candidatus Saccharimonadales bacterium]